MGIKRKPQEIANFFRMYLAQDRTREWYLYESKPAIRESVGYWIADSGREAILSESLIEVSADHDWHTMYEPQLKDTAPHQSEVYVGERYVLLGEFHPGTLMQKVEEYLNKGFKLYGSPWTGPDCGSCGYIHYQAMVRGV